MCGIAGACFHRTGRPVEPALVGAMLDLMAARGPDGRGIWCDGEFGFGAVRLAVIGGPEGDQPLWSPDGRLGLVANAEIFNYRELGRQIGSPSRSDLQVLVRLLALQGCGSLSRVNGMFAGAAFSRADRSLTLFRDALGEKPLFVAELPDGVAFASALAPLLLLLGPSRELDFAGLSAFLTLGYLPPHLSAVKGVGSLEPGSWRRFGGAGGAGRFWSVPAVREPAPGSDPAAAFRAVFAGAVGRRLVSDVPVTMFLSGGIDSTAVLGAWLRGDAPRPPVVFTLAVEGGSEDLERARASCRDFNLRLEEVPLAPEDIPRRLPQIVAATDSLLANPPQFALDALARAAAGSFKVALGGLGGDELFHGYPTWKADRLFRLYRRAPAPLRRWAARLADLLPVRYGPHALSYALRAFLSCPADEPRRAHAWWRTIVVGEELAALGAGFDLDWYGLGYERSYEEAARAAPGDWVRQTVLADLGVWLSCMGLYEADAVGMASGVEIRSPFLDRELVEWALSLPPPVLYDGSGNKGFLRRALSADLPTHVVRGRKLPFHVPLGAWFAGPLRGFVRDSLVGDRGAVDAVVSRAGRERIVADHLARRRDNSFKILCLLVLSSWLEGVFHGAGRALPKA